MRLLLLTSASILGLSGAAMAQDGEVQTGIIFGGDASFGFNSFEFLDDDDVSADDREEEGFFYEADLNITFRTILNNGAVAESTFSIPIADNNLGNDLEVDDDFVLGLNIDGQGGIFLGDVTFAAEDHFSFATMQSADFSEQDSETVVKGTGTFGNVEVSASALVLDSEGDEPGEAPAAGVDERDFIDQISVGAEGEIGRFSFSLGYQEESDVFSAAFQDEGDEIGDGEGDEGIYDPGDSNGDFNPAENIGISLGTNFAGFDVQLGYGRNLSGADPDLTDGFDPEETQSFGVTAGFPVGPVTLTAELVSEPDAELYADEDNPDPDDISYAIGAEYESERFILEASFGEEIGEEEYDVRALFAVGEVTSVGAGYNDDDGGFAFVRQGIGAGAFVEASYAETDDVGFEQTDFSGLTELDDDIREGVTLRVGLEF